MNTQIGRRAHNFIDMTGKKFGMLTVVRYARKDRHRLVMWLCKCDCGNEKEIRGQSLRRGYTESCGCIKREGLGKGVSAFNRLYSTYKKNLKKSNKKHGKNLKFGLTEEQFRKITKQDCYWCGMEPKQECTSKGHTGPYIYNGADRVDNNKGYSVENCVSCCKICNYMKSDKTQEEFLSHVERIHDKWRREV